MLKEFVFLVIIISAYQTWHSTFLFQKTKSWETKSEDDPPSIAPVDDKNKDKDEDKKKDTLDT